VTANHSVSASWGLFHQAIVGLNDERDIGNVFTAWTPVKAGSDLPGAMHAILGWSGSFPGFRLAIEGYYKDYSSLQVPIFSPFPRFTTRLESADGLAYGQYGSGLPFTPSAGFDEWYLFTPDVDVTSEAGIDRILYAERNSARQPTYARVDVFIQRKIERGRYVGTLRAGAINVFNRDNLFYFDLFTFKRVDQLPVVPSVGMKLELR
jgi:hypothetical protein